MTLAGLLRQRAAADPGGVYMIIPGKGGPDTHVTYAGVYRRARAVAAWLSEQADEGELVLLAAAAGADFAAGFFGAVMAGCRPVPVPPPYPGGMARRYEHIREDCADPRVRDGGPLVLAGGGLHRLFAGAGRSPAYIPALEEPPDGWEPDCRLDPSGAAYAQYTSGTGGDPRGALIAHRAALAGLRMTSGHMCLAPGMLSASWLPPWHDLGLGALLLALYARCPVVVTQPLDWLANPVRWLSELSRRQVQVTPLPSFAWRFMARHVRRATADELAAIDLRSWKHAWSGAEPADYDGVAAFQESVTGHGFGDGVIKEMYGFAEAFCAVAGQAHGSLPLQVTADPAYLAAGRVVHRDSGRGVRLQEAGQPLGGTRVRTMLLDGTGFCMPGEIGELLVRGPQLAGSYWHGTPWVTAGGELWLRTGDVAALDEDDRIVLFGRRDDMITTGEGRLCRRYFPALLERAALAGAGGAVRRCAVFSAGGVRMAIAVETWPDADLAAAEDAIRDSVKNAFGVTLEDVLFLPRGRIPSTTSGKARRGELARRYRESGDLAGLLPRQPQAAQ